MTPGSWQPQGNNKEQFFPVCTQSCSRLSDNYIAPFTQVLTSNAGLVLRWWYCIVHWPLSEINIGTHFFLIFFKLVYIGCFESIFSVCHFIDFILCITESMAGYSCDPWFLKRNFCTGACCKMLGGKFNCWHIFQSARWIEHTMLLGRGNQWGPIWM